MHVHGLLLAALHAFSLVVKLTDATRTGLMTPFKFSNGGWPESRVVVARKIKTAPYLKTVWIFGVLRVDRVKFVAHGHRENDCLFHANLVHVPNPFSNLLRGFGVGMGMHIDDWKLGLRHLRYRNLVDGFWAVVLEKYLLGGFCIWLTLCPDAVAR